MNLSTTLYLFVENVIMLDWKIGLVVDIVSTYVN